MTFIEQYNKNRKYAKKCIQYNNKVKTSRYTLTLLVITSLLLINHIAHAATFETPEIHDYSVSRALLEEKAEERRQESFLAELRVCESSFNDYAVGDNGESLGPYQWQKPTLEDKLGREVTDQEYRDIVTDYETIHELTKKTYFEDGEYWRWLNCHNKITA